VAKSGLETKYTEICAEAKIRLFFLRPAGLSCAKGSEPEANERKWKLRRGEGLTFKWMAGGVKTQSLYDCRAVLGRWVKKTGQVPMLQRISIWGTRPHLSLVHLLPLQPHRVSRMRVPRPLPPGRAKPRVRGDRRRLQAKALASG
jgi:hypothetical protein